MGRKTVPGLARKYRLEEWTIQLEVVDADQMEDTRSAAETLLKPAYRIATIRFERDFVLKSRCEMLREYLVHEVQHIPYHFLDELMDLVLNYVHDPIARKVLSEQFHKAHERATTYLGRMQSEGCFWEAWNEP